MVIGIETWAERVDDGIEFSVFFANMTEGRMMYLLDGLREGNLRKVLLESGCPTAQIESDVRTAIARLNEAEAA